MNHSEMQAKCKKMSVAGLEWTARDCFEAEKVGRGWNPKCGEYIDMMLYCGMELKERRS